MADQFVGEIRMFAGNFAPRDWALCNGQELPIAQNTALFSLLGTFYGGNGISTFALPNLQGCAPMHSGQGPGLSDRFIGESGGSETVSLTANEMPTHGHTVNISAQPGTSMSPNGKYLAGSAARNVGYAASANSTMTIGSASTPHNNMQPFLVLNFIIALQGVFPARS